MLYIAAIQSTFRQLIDCGASRIYRCDVYIQDRLVNLTCGDETTTKKTTINTDDAGHFCLRFKIVSIANVIFLAQHTHTHKHTKERV